MSICLEVTKQRCISLANGCVRWLSECSVANLPKASFPSLNEGITKGSFSFESTLTYLHMHATVCKWLVLKYIQWKSLIEGSCFVYIRRWITAIAKSKIFVCAVSSGCIFKHETCLPLRDILNFIAFGHFADSCSFTEVITLQWIFEPCISWPWFLPYIVLLHHR